MALQQEMELPQFRKHAWNTTAHTLLFDLEDGCRQKEMSRELLKRELPGMPRKKEVQVAVRDKLLRARVVKPPFVRHGKALVS